MREEEKKRTSPVSKMQRLFRKRWVYPALYLIAAAIILTGVLWFQNSGDDVAEDKKESAETSYHNDEPAVPVNKPAENFAMPVLNPDEAVIAKEFYESDAPKEKQEAALVYYDNTYRQNKGIDIAMNDGKSFDVVASLSGTVSKVADDSILGNIVEIEHEKGVVTVYQSLADVKVEIGEAVKQGQVIGTAGTSVYDKEVGTHVHFEIRKDGTPVNPLKYVEKPLASLDDVNQEENAAETDQSKGTSSEVEDSSTQTDENISESKHESTSESPDASISMANA